MQALFWHKIKYMNRIYHNELFKDFEKSDIEKLIDTLEYVSCPAETYLFTEECSEATLFFVAEGTLSSEIQAENEVLYHAGDYFGEVSFLNNTFRSGKIKSVTDSTLFKLKRTDFFDANILSPQIALQILSQLAIRVTTYLHTRENTATKILIKYGENEYVEFKSTLRTNLFTGKFDHAIEHASLKTIAGFLNSEGGTLLIGVEDNGNICGIEKDLFQNEDKALLHLTNLIKTQLSMLHLAFINMHTEICDGKSIIRVDVKPANVPVYMNCNNLEVMYVRTGPSTTILKVSEVYDYVKNRFK